MYIIIFMKIYKILILLFLIYQTHISFGSESINDSIVAIVNHHIILDSDIKKNLNIIQYDISNINKYLSLTNSSHYQEILNQLITIHLIFDISKKENIFVEDYQINQCINNILHLRNIKSDQFQTYLNTVGLSYKQYYLKLYQDMANYIICNHIVHQRIQISPNEINEITQTLNSIDYNKEFKIIHIIFPLPIQATQNQIKIAEALAQSCITNDNNQNNITDLINTYNSKNHIFQTIKIQKTKWVTWKNIPIIFDPYLQTINIGSIIGPIHSYDGIHILKIQDIRYKKFQFPITKVKIKTIVLKNTNKKYNAYENLLKIKKCIENGNTTFDMLIKEKPQNYYIMHYQKNLEWHDLNNFESKIKKSLINLKKQEISMPINSSFGWCLIQLIDINDFNYATMMRERAYYYLLHQKFNGIINNWTQELKSISYIKIIK